MKTKRVVRALIEKYGHKYDLTNGYIPLYSVLNKAKELLKITEAGYAMFFSKEELTRLTLVNDTNRCFRLLDGAPYYGVGGTIKEVFNNFAENGFKF